VFFKPTWRINYVFKDKAAKQYSDYSDLQWCDVASSVQRSAEKRCDGKQPVTRYIIARNIVARKVAGDGHTVKQLRDVAEVGADSTSATVARNVACNSFKGGHTM